MRKRFTNFAAAARKFLRGSGYPIGFSDEQITHDLMKPVAWSRIDSVNLGRAADALENIASAGGRIVKSIEELEAKARSK